MKTAAAMTCAMLTAVVCLAEGATNPQASALEKKLDAIIFPVLEFNQANLNDVVPYLAGASKGHDPAKVGVSIVLMDRENEAEINMNLKDVSLLKALKLLAGMSGLSLEFEGQTVVLRKPTIKK